MGKYIYNLLPWEAKQGLAGELRLSDEVSATGYLLRLQVAVDPLLFSVSGGTAVLQDC